MADDEPKIWVRAQKFVNSTGGAGELGIIIIVHDDDSLRGEARSDELEASLNGGIEVTVAKGERNFLRKVLVGEVAKPGFLDDDGRKIRVGMAGGLEAMFVELVKDFALGDEEGAGLEISTGTRGILSGLLWEASKGIVDPEMFIKPLSGRKVSNLQRPV